VSEAQDDHDLGLTHDLTTLFTRRRALAILGGSAVAVLVGCSGDDDSSAASTTSSTAGSEGDTASCADPIPEETAGPFPGDGSNGPDALTQSGIVRRDITSSFGSSTTKAEGVPTTLTLAIQSNDCDPMVGAAVYVWHCDREGRYSMYSPGVEDENYLRGVQTTGDDGRVSFTTVMPGCYTGRWPHIHFEVYSSVDDATGGGRPIATSQVAVPKDTCEAAYAADGYAGSVTALSQVSLTSDMVFADDGGVRQLATVTGDVDRGYALDLTVPV
jgi:protocatechuate 3,4-dioxygenase beta subunit